VTQLTRSGEFMEARTEELTEPVTEGLDKLLESITSAFASSRFKSPAANRSISLASGRNPSAIADRIASDLPLEVSQKQELLELLNPAKRLEKLLDHLSGPLGPITTHEVYFREPAVCGYVEVQHHGIDAQHLGFLSRLSILHHRDIANRGSAAGASC
jgi:hypothetical protein